MRNQELEIGKTEAINSYFTKVYGWMFFSLLITFACAHAIANIPSVTMFVYGNPLILIGSLIAELILVMVFCRSIYEHSVSTVRTLFLIHSVLFGVSLSSVFLVYTETSIAFTFLMAALYFGTLCIIGATTKADLSKLGMICIIGLFVLIIAEVICLFAGVSTNTMFFTAIGLLIFTGLTAWDSQKMKNNFYRYGNDERMLQNIAIYSAMDLSLDFINIFLYLLRFFGKSKD